METVLNDMMKSMDIFVNVNKGELIFYGIIGCHSPILLRWVLPPGPLSLGKILENIKKLTAFSQKSLFIG
jgi:hypothetical protein